MVRTRFLTWILMACAAVLFCTATRAQELATAVQSPAASLPGWVVLVLKPIGLERVRPVTGIVISAQGLVLVPLDFAVPGDQIIILDGGTDIAKNGRAATVKTQLGSVGLTVLSAPLLKRTPATLAATPLQDGDAIHLAAFPPAEQIAQGSAPLLIAAELAVSTAPAGQVNVTPSMISIKAGKELPNVSGPLLDACGNLVGWGSSNGVQSMETNASPAYLWQDGLQQALGSVAVKLVMTPCPAVVPALAADLAVDDIADATGAEASAAADAGPASAELSAEPEPTDAVQQGREAGTAPVEDAGLEGTLAIPGQIVAEAGGHGPAFWVGLGLLLAVLLLALLLAFRWCLRKWRGAPDEPVPSLLQDALPRFLRSGRITGQPAVASIPEPADSVLEINGNLPNGASFQASCNVRSAAVDAVIGRGDSDITIDSPDVQRVHARIGGSADRLTITDLGSTRGTWINRVPCLKGEIMFIGPEDMIFLGDVSFRILVRPR
jgi:hypothetical protein